MIRRLVDWLVAQAVPPDERDAALGDLAEEYERSGGSWRGRRAYLSQAASVGAYGLWSRRWRPGASIGAMSRQFASDMRLAARGLRRTPGFTIAAALTLAIGIGAAVAIFSAVYPIVFEPLPYPQAQRVLLMTDFNVNGQPLDVTFGTFREIEARSRSLSAIGAADLWTPALTGDNEAPERLTGQRVSAQYFHVLGIPPRPGRAFTDAECQPGGPNVAILSAGLVARRFAGDPGIVGRRVLLNAVEYEVVGVMPREFENVLAPAADVWAPMQFRSPAPFQGAEWGHHISIVGRLRPEATLDGAQRDIDGIASAPAIEFPRPPWAALGRSLAVSRLQDQVTRGVRPMLLAIFGAVALVLVIACVNVTNLLLARGLERRGELAVRAALGADRARLVRYLLAESLVLAAIGGGLGLGLAEAGVRALVALSPPNLPRVNAIHVDGTVFLFALLVIALTGFAVGLVPALGASQIPLSSSLQSSSRRATGGRQLVRRALVVAEVALAIVLLVSAGLLWRSLSQLFSNSPGFDASRVLTMQVQVVGTRYQPDSAKLAFFDRALEAVRAVPGVTAAAFTNQVPLSGDFESYGVRMDSPVPNVPGGDGAACRYAVTPDYFAAMGIPLRRGRLFDAGDRPGAPEAVLISESFARSRFPNQDPIGQRVRFGPEIGADQPWDVIVGVVGDVRQASLALAPYDGFYVSAGQWVWVDRLKSLVVRTTLDPASLAADVKRAIWSVDKDQPIIRVSTMAALVERSEAERRFALTIFQLFAIVALGLAAIGLFGVLSASVTERRREIGVRAALGASRDRILRLVIGQGLLLSAMGVLIGLAGAAMATRALTTLLFGVSRLDPWTHAGVVAVLGGVSFLACWIPAWRAARVDPMTALRSD